MSDEKKNDQAERETLDENEQIAQRRQKLAAMRETGNTQAVLDGDLDQFIEASLKSGL